MKSIINMTQEELDERFRPIVEKLIEDQYRVIGYIITRDERCNSEAEFIRKYRDGSEELVELELDTKEFRVIHMFS